MTTAEEEWQALRSTINMSALAEALHITPAAVSAWKRVPAMHTFLVSKILGKAPWVLRPDLYPPPDPWSGI